MSTYRTLKLQRGLPLRLQSVFKHWKLYDGGNEEGRLNANSARGRGSQEVSLQPRENKQDIYLLPITEHQSPNKTTGLLQLSNQTTNMPKILTSPKLVKCGDQLTSVVTKNSVIYRNNQHPEQAFSNLPSTMVVGNPIINPNNLINSISSTIKPILVTNKTFNPLNKYAFNPATGLIQLPGNILYFNQALDSPQKQNTIPVQNNISNIQTNISSNAKRKSVIVGGDKNKKDFIPIVPKTAFKGNTIQQIGVINGLINSVVQPPLMLLNNSQNTCLVVNDNVKVEKPFNESIGNIKKTVVLDQNNKSSASCAQLIVPQLRTNLNNAVIEINQSPPLALKSVLPKQENTPKSSNTKKISEGKQKLVTIAPKSKAPSFIKVVFEEMIVESAESITRTVFVKHHYCKICNSQFPTLVEVTAHVNQHIMRTCFECKVIFSTESGLENHKLVQHAFNKCDIQTCSHRVCHQYSIVDASESNRCHKCSAMFKDNEALLNHQCNATNKVKGSSSKVSSNKLFRCLVCFKTYTKRLYVLTHLKDDHKDVGKISCNDCSSTFKKKKNLRAHINKEHKPPKHKCEVCSVTFNTPNKLKIHLSNQHLIEKRKIFVCNVCGKTLKYLKSSKTIEQHLLTHTDEKPFMCEVCGKSFRTQPNLYQHSRTHSEDRPYSCAVCDKTFRIKNHLNQHMTVHSKVSTSTVRKRKRKRQETSSDSENEGNDTDDS